MTLKAEGLARSRNPSAVDNNAQRSDRRCEVDGSLNVSFRTHIGGSEAEAMFGGDLDSTRAAQVGDGDLRTVRGESASGGQAESTGATGDERCGILNFH
mgnify:CR=1 FL=1